MKLNNNYSKIHMIGITGISMSGIACILSKSGYTVTGSTNTYNVIIEELKQANIKVYIGHDPKNIDNADLVVYTAAISKDNPELLEAKRLNIPIMERSEFMGELTKLFSKTIAISGTHGKTTTTSMISLCFLEANLDPSIQVGSILKQINGNYLIGNSDYFIIEACEYVDSFLSFYPQTEIILNIEEEHLDYFKDINQIIDSFIKFTQNLPVNGNLVINIDNENVKNIMPKLRKDINILTYSINDSSADIFADNIRFDDNGYGVFDIKYKDNIIKNISISVPGLHNVSNACACIATCIFHNISFDIIKKALKKYNGVSRRFEIKGKTKNNCTVIDDYAHHPTEIKALLNSTKNGKYNKVWAVFQPHTYSRVKTLLNDFIDCFNNADYLILTDIYAAREVDDGTVSSKMLTDMINEKYPNKAIYISKFEDIAKYLDNNTHENDLILTIGAGNITDLSKFLLK